MKKICAFVYSVVLSLCVFASNAMADGKGFGAMGERIGDNAKGAGVGLVQVAQLGGIGLLLFGVVKLIQSRQQGGEGRWMGLGMLCAGGALLALPELADSSSQTLFGSDASGYDDLID